MSSTGVNESTANGEGSSTWNSAKSWLPFAYKHCILANANHSRTIVNFNGADAARRARREAMNRADRLRRRCPWCDD